MLSFIESKAFEAYVWLKNVKDESGQTTAEYVAVTAVAVGLGITVIFFILGGALNEAVQTISDSITDFVDDTVGGGGAAAG